MTISADEDQRNHLPQLTTNREFEYEFSIGLVLGDNKRNNPSGSGRTTKAPQASRVWLEHVLTGLGSNVVRGAAR